MGTAANNPLSLARTLAGARLVVVGGTGFLGKVWLSMLLTYFPNIGKIYLVVRSKKGADSEARFWADIASSPPFDPVRAAHPGSYEEFLRSKVEPIDADVSKPLCGFTDAMVARLQGQVDAVVNVAGVVDFNPPLDEALLANAFGVKNLVDVARALGDVPMLHTSTAYVAGYRKGQIDEIDPRERPFPKMGELEAVHWSPEREIQECLDLVAQARHRTEDAFRQSYFLDQAKRNLLKKGEPTQGRALDDELQKVRRHFEQEKLIEAGNERATHWGWTNIYTYTKSLGEQILAGSGLRFTLVRPTVIESSIAFPFPAWNEGINTMGPLIYLIMSGHIQIPSNERTVLDVIPVDMVAGGMIVALAELLEGTQKAVYHLGSSDTSPLTMYRLVELSGIYKRLHFQNKGKGNPIWNYIAAHVEPVPVSVPDFYRQGAPAIAAAVDGLAGLLRKAGVKPVAKALSSYAGVARRNGEIWELYIPFMAGTEYRFVSDHMRDSTARLDPAERALINWTPEKIEWRHYLHEVQFKGLEKWVWPEINAKISRPQRPLRAHDDLLALLDGMAERHDLAVAYQRFESEGFTRVTFRDVQRRSEAAAGRLAAAGVAPGDRVMLGAQNHPDWPIAYFGILRAGGVVVPVDPALEEAAVANLLRASGARALVGDAKFLGKAADRALAQVPGVVRLELTAVADDSEAPPAPPRPKLTGDELASLLYTSGTTGTPKGVMLTHKNFCSMLASLSPLFPLTAGDRMLSVLPLHHTFEFTCGLLLPLSRGTRVIYLDDLSSERLTAAMREARVTAMAGVPALWQLIERKVTGQVRDLGPTAGTVFDLALEFNRTLGDRLGLNVGRALFGPVHQGLGGNLRYLISGGAALPPDTARLFAGLGLHLAEGYGLTEASPVLTVAQGKPGARVGHVGKPVPGVEIKIGSPDASGVGEVMARGPNVMAGYYGNTEATAETLTDGWLHTGDLGKMDRKGVLTLVGRSKDVVVGANGENVYPDDVERLLGDVPGVSELCVVGIADPRGGERAACLAVPERPVERGEQAPSTEEFIAAREHAMKQLRQAIGALPTAQQPPVVLLHDEKLPRTATRKVKRSEVRALVERLVLASAPRGDGGGHRSAVRSALAAIARRDEATLAGSLRLRDDLGLDSLMSMELVAALETALPGRRVAAAVAAAGTVAELESALDVTSDGPTSRATIERDEPRTHEAVVLPESVRDAAKTAMALIQQKFYGDVMKPRVTGRSFIPHNRNTIVVANHTSHLDMGLVKYALGSYGRDLVALAARDYFFESSQLRRNFVENFTNLAPLDRSGNLRETLRDVGQLIDEGKTLLLFPEGTRTPDGQMREFKGAAGHLALRHEVDLLPVHLGGTFEALPKNARIPTRRDLRARIGPPLEVTELRRLTAHLKPAQAARRVSLIAQRAVEALRDGGVLDLRTAKPGDFDDAPRKHPVVVLFEELERRFQPGAVDQPVSFYFTLGDDAEAKWTVKLNASDCTMANGKPAGGSADCVLKTNVEMFSRIVREGYTPVPAEFFAGTIKTNDPSLLFTFQRAFNLTS